MLLVSGDQGVPETCFMAPHQPTKHSFFRWPSLVEWVEHNAPTSGHRGSAATLTARAARVHGAEMWHGTIWHDTT